MFTKRDDGGAEQVESCRYPGRRDGLRQWISRKRTAESQCCRYIMCIAPVRSIRQLRAFQAPEDPGTGVWQWGPCSRVGEAGRPGGQRRSEMTAAAVVVGGLALWRGHPVCRCSIVHASAAALHPPRASFITITSVHPCLLRTRDGLAGWGRRRTRRLAYMCAVCVAMWSMYVIRYVGWTAIRGTYGRWH